MGDLLNNIGSKLNAEQFAYLEDFIQAERFISSELEADGHVILAHNYFAHNVGEVDIISYKDGILYATEVKARKEKDRFGGALAQFTPAKQARVIKALYHYATYRGQSDTQIKILAASIVWDEDNNIIDHNIRDWELY